MKQRRRDPGDKQQDKQDNRRVGKADESHTDRRDRRGENDNVLTAGTLDQDTQKRIEECRNAPGNIEKSRHRKGHAELRNQKRQERRQDRGKRIMSKMGD